MSFQFSLYVVVVSVEYRRTRAGRDRCLRARHRYDASDEGGHASPAAGHRWAAQGVERDLELLHSSMTVRLGSIQVVTAGLLFAALKLT